ncbi:MAG TPA: hypothetical protein VGG48_16740 [Rhizomicrobium sp.]|jgi:hypothetical protein
MARNQKFALFMALAIIGGLGIALSTFLAVGRAHGAPPDMARIIAGTLIVALAMGWAMFFTVRAHFAQDEFKRQREISASFWGGWMGIAASAPVFFFIAMGGLGHLATVSAPPVRIFTIGYLLPTIFGVIGTIGARFWLRRRDS